MNALHAEPTLIENEKNVKTNFYNLLKIKFDFLSLLRKFYFYHCSSISLLSKLIASHFQSFFTVRL